MSQFGTNDEGYWLNAYDSWIKGDGLFRQPDVSVQNKRREDTGPGPSKRPRG